MEIVKKLVWYFIRREGSLSSKFRKKRFNIFLGMVETLPKPMKILDVGGVQDFWERVNYTDPANVNISLINIEEQKVTLPNFKSITGDARDLSQFKDREFDLVFSNSLIEHVGDYHDQKRAAKEIIRTGKRYYVQTPNFFFPIEQHLLVPFFQFFPVSIKLFIMRHSKLIYSRKLTNRDEAMSVINHIQLLTARKMKELFPGAKIYRERILGFTKSIIVIGGDR